MELVRIVHWLDHRAGRALLVLRESPGWFFVTLVGIFSVGLTVLLFISMIVPTPSHHVQLAQHRTTAAAAGREQLERNNEWSAQDRWRVAHMFVPNKPTPQPKNIHLDSRLMAPLTNSDRSNRSSDFGRTSMAEPSWIKRDFDVRLEMHRPKKAEQDQRFAGGTIIDSAARIGEQPRARIRSRDPRLLVQATWEYGSECNQREYPGLPVRRIRPVPVPPDEPHTRMVPIRKFSPDLSFELELIRHSSVSGHFPPGSRIISQSDRSVFPDDDARFQSGLVSFSDSGWQRSHTGRHHPGDDLISYMGVGAFDPLSAELPTSDEIDPTLPAMAEVELRLELVTPHSVSAGQPHQSKLFISNAGRDSIPRVEVKDQISRLQTVVAANPDALIETVIDAATGLEERLLHREIQQLVPGQGQEFVLQWIPNDGRHQFHRTRVVAHAAVATTTEVSQPAETEQPTPTAPPEILPEKHPALACDIQYLDKVYVGDEVDLEITVRNTGDTKLHNVQVRIDVPNQLSHRDGKNVVFEAGTLDVSGRNQTILKMSAKQAGDAVNVLQVAAVEQVVARGQARIVVVERGKEPAALPETIRSQPAVGPAPATKVSPVPTQPAKNCCCQELSMIRSEPRYQFP